MENQKYELGNVGVLIVDMQSFYMRNGFGLNTSKNFIGDVSDMLDTARLNMSPVWFAEIGNPERGFLNGRTVEDLGAPRCIGDPFLILKEGMSAFESVKLESGLRENGISKLVISGVYESQCVYESAAGAVVRGIEVISSEDLVVDTPYVTAQRSQTLRDFTTFFSNWRNVAKYVGWDEASCEAANISDPQPFI